MQKPTTTFSVIFITALLLASTGAKAADASQAQHIKTGKGTGNGLWSLPAARQWDRNAVSIDWSIPPASQRWTTRDKRLNWRIPGTAAELQQGNR